MADVRQTPEELDAQLAKQIRFLEASCELYDAGHEDEAVRLAQAVRVLVHDGRRALLAQIGQVMTHAAGALPFLSTGRTASPPSPKGAGAGLTIRAVHHTPLAPMRFGSGDIDSRYVPACALQARAGPGATQAWTSFPHWWKEYVIKGFDEPRNATLTRQGVVLALANQDGGSHVGPLDPSYHELTRGGLASPVVDATGVGFVTPNPGIEYVDVNIEPVRATMRQIAHETLVSLRRAYPELVRYDPAA